MNENHEQQPGRSTGHLNICLTCGRSILRVRSRAVLRDEMSEREILVRDVISEWIHPRQLQPSDELCIPCWLRAQRVANTRSQPSREVEAIPGPSNAPTVNVQNAYQEPQVEEVPVTVQLEDVGAEPKITLLTLRRAASTARHCLFPECDGREKLRVPNTIRKRIILDYNFYIPVNSRICTYHLHSNTYHELYTANNSLSVFTVTQIEDIIFLLKEQTQLDFTQVENIDDHLFKYWFGRTKNEYNMILTEVPRVNDLKIKMGLNALLCKLRTGDSDERISALFQKPRRTLESYMEQARDILLQDYVPLHLGLEHVRREDVVARNSYLANNVFGNPEEPIENRHLITIVDGTYLNVQKSSNYSFQKKTYSLHKYKNLIKPFLIVCCDGYIIDALGPYPATINDAEIMKEFIESNSLSRIFKEDDIFILDRGFRDCRDDLYQKGFQVHMPESIEDGERQLTTLQANISRCVTMNRWVVEAVNGRFSRDFKIFRADFSNKRCPVIMKEFSIAAAFLNHFANQFTERRNVQPIIDIIHDKLFEDNILGQIVARNNLNMRHRIFHNISRTNLVFPQLSLDDLEMIALGTYQIRQAKSYVGEHLRAHGIYHIEVCHDDANAQIVSAFGGIDPYVLRARIKSRHVGSKSYYTYIVVDRGIPEGYQSILGYYCHCAAGKRTVGCCSHTMSILWYMGYASRQGHIEAPAAFLDDVLIN